MSRPTTPLPSSQTSPPTSAPRAPQSSPFRSTTAPVKKHHHHHHHITHRHHHHQRDKSVPQSAVLPSSTSSTFDNLFSPLTKVTSRTEGAPDISSLIRDEREARARKEARERDGEKSKDERARLDKEAVKRGWEAVERRRAERKRGQDALATSLSTLSTLSTTTTRRLDYTYYSLLSHISALHNAVSSIASLSSTTSSLLSSFSTQSSDLQNDLDAKISQHRNDTDTQSSRITQLEKRVHDGKSRVESLGHRMDQVRKKVREQERRDGESNERVRRRVRMCWGMLATALVLGVVGVVVQHWPRVGREVENAEVAVGRFAGRTGEILGEMGAEGGVVVGEKSNGTAEKVGVGVVGAGAANRVEDSDRVMRMLDEL